MAYGEGGARNGNTHPGDWWPMVGEARTGNTYPGDWLPMVGEEQELAIHIQVTGGLW